VRGSDPDWQALARLIEDWAPDALVVGLPITADGKPHALAPAVQRFARRLEGRYGLPVHMVDERLSSHEAESRVSPARLGIDAVAAQLILETWMEARHAR